MDGDREQNNSLAWTILALGFKGVKGQDLISAGQAWTCEGLKLLAATGVCPV